MTQTRPWPEARSTRGLVATPHALASEAGVAVMRRGGNALDAAIAAAATIAVVYPHMNGIGGDNVWLIYDAARGQLRGLNAAGRAAAACRSGALPHALRARHSRRAAASPRSPFRARCPDGRPRTPTAAT